MDEVSMFAEMRPRPGPVDLGGARDQLAAAIGTAPGRRIPRRTWSALGGGLVAAAAATAIVLSAAPPHSGAIATTGVAWTVSGQADGTVTITLHQEFSDAAGLERALRADGITAYVRSTAMVSSGRVRHPACVYNLGADTISSHVVVSEHFPAPRGPLGTWSWTIRPSAMPRGSALFLWTRTDKATGAIAAIGEPAVLRNQRAPVCLPYRFSP